MIDNDDYNHDLHPYAFTDRFCDSCGAELRRWEVQDFEDTCFDCVKANECPVIDDDAEREL